MSTTPPAPAAGATALTGAAPAAAGTAQPPPIAQAGPSTPPGASAETAVAGGKSAAEATPAALELKLPDGFEPNDELLTQFKAHATELGLKSEGAQKLFDLYAGAQAAQAKAQSDAAEAQHKGWLEALKTDKEVGGAQFEANKQTAFKAMVKFGANDPELRELLNSGLGDHPALVRLMYRVGKSIDEDSISGTSSGAGNGKAGPMSDEALALAMYPKMLAKKDA